MLVYKLSGLPMMISDEMVEKIKKGTKPEDIATQSEVDEIQLLLMETINQTESDLENKILLIIKNTQHLQDCTKSALDAIAFNDFHEGMHIGVIMSIRKFI
jgi:hypothetical protein